MSDLPRGWVKASGDDLFSSVRGVTYSKSDSSHTPGNGLVPILRANNIVGGGITTDDLVFVPAKCVSPEQNLQDGDLLIASSSGSRTVVGKAATASDDDRIYAFGAFCTVARPRTGDLGRWLAAYSRSRAYRDYVEKVALGISINNLRGSDLKAIPIPVAPLREQRRIVAKIDSLTGKSRRARNHLDHIPRLVEKYKQAILAAAFRGDLTREWREANGLPSFQSVRLPELLAEPIRNGLSVRGSDTPPGVRALRLSALRGGTVDLSDVRFLPITDDQSARFLLREGDVLVSRGNGTKAFVGLAALVGAVEFPTIFPDTAFRLRPNLSRASPSWLALIWNAPPMREQIERVAKTTAGIWKISQGNLNEIDILLPSPAEQTEIVRRISSAFDWIDRLFKDASSARKLVDHFNQAVLAKAFKGELVPQDPADEPASALLDRIREERATAPKAKRGRKQAA